MDTRTVLFYGKSTLLSLLASDFVASPTLRVLYTASPAEVATLTAGNAPDVLVYDLAAACESAILPLLFERPDMLLVGLDVEANRAVLLTGEERRCLSLQGVRELLERR